MAVGAPSGRGPGRGAAGPRWRVPQAQTRRGEGRSGAGGPRPPDGRGQPRSPRWLTLLGSSPFGRRATSGGGSRRPGMAAWSPAAAARLLRRIRGVSTGRAKCSPRGGSCGGAAGSGQGLPVFSLVHSFFHSSIHSFSGPGNRHSGKCQDPVRGGTPRAGWRPGGGDTQTPRHPDTPVQRHGKSSADLSSRGYHGAGAG